MDNLKQDAELSNDTTQLVQQLTEAELEQVGGGAQFLGTNLAA